MGTEKLFDGLAGVFGKGAADDVIEGLIGKLSGSNTGRSLLRAFSGAAGEGTEEVISDLLDPFARLIYNDQALKEAWENRAELRSQMLYDYLIGAAMGGLGSVTGAVTGQYAEKNAVLAGMDGQVQAQMETAPLVQTPVQTKAQTQAQAQAKATEAAQTAEGQKISAQDRAENKGNEGESVSVVERLREKIPEISDMHPVAETSSDAVISYNGQTMAEKARVLFEKIKGTVTRKNFGDVEINGRSAKDDLSHGIGVAKAAVIPSIPQVIQSGRQIDFQSEWKGRPYDGYVFAAPVVLDGRTTYVAAVVKKTSKNRFYLHEVVDSDGNIIKINDGEKANPTSLASVDDAGTRSPSQREAVAPKDSIALNGEKSNGNPQSIAKTGNTAAKTDSAALVLQQQYQTEIATALQSGDYQHALKLFNEFGNPNLRALNEVQTLRAFAEFANAAGYGISPAATEEFTGNNPVKNWSQETDSTNAAEKSTEDESIRKFRNDIKEGKVSLRISPQKQARHIWGSKEHNAYRERLSNRGDFPSYIREDLTLADLTEIVKKKAGDGSIGQKTDMSFKEYVDCDEIIGYYYSKEEGKYVPTYRAQIIYSLGDRNIHIVPVKRLNEVKK